MSHLCIGIFHETTTSTRDLGTSILWGSVTGTSQRDLHESKVGCGVYSFFIQKFIGNNSKTFKKIWEAYGRLS